jgi:hypothetical protein
MSQYLRTIVLKISASGTKSLWVWSFSKERSLICRISGSFDDVICLKPWIWRISENVVRISKYKGWGGKKVRLKAMPGHDDHCLWESLFKNGSGRKALQVLLTTQVSHQFSVDFVVLRSLVDPSFSSPCVGRAVECYNSNLNYIQRNSPKETNFYHIRRHLFRASMISLIFYVFSHILYFCPLGISWGPPEYCGWPCLVISLWNSHYSN